MDTKIRYLRLFAAWFIALVMTAATFALNNADVIKMAQAGLGEDVILAAVRTADPADFATSTDDLIELKQRGVSDAIIQAMILRQQGGADGWTGRESRISFTPAPDSAVLPPEITPEPGGDYFVRYSFRFEKNERPTTNYWRGEHVPINTRVTLVGIRKDRLTLRLIESGREIVVKNVPEYTVRDIEQIAREMLSDEPTAIEKYGEEMARHIRSGTPRLGMTKTQVLLTRGYPPAHETPSLDGDMWKYWSNRFAIHSFAFQNGILVEARGVH